MSHCASLRHTTLQQQAQLDQYRVQFAKLQKVEKAMEGHADYVLSIRLSLAKLNKQYQQAQSQLKKEQRKGALVAEENCQLTEAVEKLRTEVAACYDEIKEVSSTLMSSRLTADSLLKENQALAQENEKLKVSNAELLQQLQAKTRQLADGAVEGRAEAV